MPKIKFVLNHQIRQADGKGPLYRVGQVVELTPESCAYFTSRGVAVDLPDDEPPKPGKPAVKGAKDEGESDGAGATDEGAGTTSPPPPPPPTVPPVPPPGPPKGGKSAK